MAREAKEEVGVLAALSFADLKAIVALGLPLDQVKELAASGYDVEQIKELAAILPKAVATSGGLSKDDLKELLAGQAAGMKQALKPENFPSKNQTSAFNPEGMAVRPTLGYTNEDGKWVPRATFFVGARMDEDILTNDEIEAFNAVTHDCTAKQGRWIAEVKQNGKTQELHIMVPHKELSDRMDLPNHEGALVAICLELRNGPKAANPLDLIKRVAALEAEAKAREAQTVPV
jgi:hypothetical protein